MIDSDFQRKSLYIVSDFSLNLTYIPEDKDSFFKEEGGGGWSKSKWGSWERRG